MPNSIGRRSFVSLFFSQALGALNDNLVKVVVSFVILASVVDPDLRRTYLSLTQALFVLPYILFSSYAGYLADRYPKSAVLKVTKFTEVLISIAIFYCLVAGHIPLLLGLLFFMGLHSTFFSPSKFGVLPEILDRDDLSKGNGYIEFGTFVAIIVGTALGGILKSIGGTDLTLAGSTVVGVALFGFAACLLIQHTPAVNPNKELERNPLKDTIQTLKLIRQDRPLWLTLLAGSYFWFLGALFQPTILLYANELMNATELQTGGLLAALAIGTGIGSICAGKVSEGKVELGLVPIGAVGMSVATALLYVAHFSFVGTLLTLLLLGLSCGFYIVPLNAFLQHASPSGDRGRYLAASNVVSFTAMFLSAAVFSILTNAKLCGFSPAEVFLILGIVTAIVGWYITVTIPSLLIRCINWCVSHLIYRMQVTGLENVPKSGGALLVCNHLSFADPSLILSSIDRPIRFIMYKPIYDLWIVKPVAKAMQAIPIAPDQGPKALVAALAEARSAIENGELVCIFAEGMISRIGRLLPFSKGFEKIMKGVDAPIIPIHLDELWGSIFSFHGGKYFWKWPKEVPYPVTVMFGAPLPGNSKAHDVRLAIEELSAESFQLRRRRHQLLHYGFFSHARRRPWRKQLSDSTGVALRSGEALIAATFLARQLNSEIERGKMVGILLPPSVGGALANLAALFAGIVPVNINFTAARTSVDSALRQTDVKVVISSRAFEEKLGLKLDLKIVYIEDLLARFTGRAKILEVLRVFLVPRRLVERLLFPSSLNHSQLATVMFSSGSTGEPKGVMLSHGNIASNIEAIYDIFQLGDQDAILGVLPLFHSFGFTGTLWLPLLAGIRAVYHPNPMDGGTIGELVQRERATVLMSTPTFLMGYLRKCTPEQFASLKHVIVGAEKLKEKLAEAFKERYGLSPLEGYGCTELSPVAMVNVPNFDDSKVQQPGVKLGTVGHPLPGVAAKVVDPESGELLLPGQAGLLLIKGPNVMQGYLHNPEKTAEVIRNGWYVTGDIAVIDDDGFVTITDRLSRFSKIGGEMVPHVKLEEEIHSVLGETEQLCFVTAVPDEKRGERLVILLKREVDVPTLLEALTAKGLPNLWLPKRDSFIHVGEFPILGTGKLDMKKLKEIALERCEGATKQSIE